MTAVLGAKVEGAFADGLHEAREASALLAYIATPPQHSKGPGKALLNWASSTL